MEPLYVVLGLILAALLGIIPAKIAQNKGYSYGLWWLFGFMLFLVALICASLLPDNSESDRSSTINTIYNQGQSAADEIKKYKELLDSGIITEEEFQKKKRQLLE